MFESKITSKQVDALRNKRGLGLSEAQYVLRKQELLKWIEESQSLEELRELVYKLAKETL